RPGGGRLRRGLRLAPHPPGRRRAARRGAADGAAGAARRRDRRPGAARRARRHQRRPAAPADRQGAAVRALRRAFPPAVRGIRLSPLIQLVAVGTIALSLLLVGSVELVARNVARLADGWGRGVQMTVYLEDGVSPARVRQIAAVLAKLPGVERVRTVEA